ncbi:outer membrane beta-barrel protein [Massilia sp. YIM B02763]|uniref:porin family protein n=1 Tax=Massilia sp. YIM B02763 TaxID=3050130 RepID=UPI0025B6621D|nr:outer membrane beta-barrel protein [Massilia sp. YIM B02763]MDN4053222.1 outer membrane beta-barrel protein [Massilia sp. YIM B02763]
MFKKIAAAAALTLLASSSFAAAPTAFYAGIDGGATKIDDLDTKGSFGGFIGYGFNQYVAIEAGYRQLGKYDVDFYGGASVDLKAKQTHVSVLGFYPLNPQLDIYGRLGWNKLRAEASYGNYSYGEDTDKVLYGIGLNYNFTPAISGRVEVQKPASDTTNYSVGVVFKF